MIWAVLNWAWKVPVLMVLTAIAFIINPILALFITHAEESETTGHPSLHPGMMREFLIKPLRIWQSEDAPVDEYYWADYEPNGWFQRAFRAKYLDSAVVRYMYRVMWLYRNPAYGFGNRLGYDATEMVILDKLDNDHLWKSGHTNLSWWIAKNYHGQIGWCFQMQWHFYKRRCLEVYLGYKLLADGKRKSVAMRFNPFRQYPK